MKKKIIAVLLIILSGGIIYAIIPPNIPLSPFSIFQAPAPINDNKYQIIGFLPHWNYSKLSDLALNTITDIAYFSLKLQGDGTIEKLTTPVSEEPGWTIYKKLLKNPPSKPLTLVFSQANKQEISTLLGNNNYQNTAITNIISHSLEASASGINIDLEPSGNIPPSMRSNYTQFIAALHLQLQEKAPSIKLSIDVYPTAASKKRLWDLKDLAQHIDYIIIMAYDYHQAGSDRAGPNAPLRGAPLEFQEDIIKNLSETIKLVPENKIILGIPFYGYEWTTTTKDKYALAESGKVASLERIQKLLQEKQPSVLWDRNTLTPYLILIEDDSIAQIYFENTKSIKLKLELVKRSNLAGIAIWALGYEGDNPELWATISDTLNTPQ